MQLRRLRTWGRMQGEGRGGNTERGIGGSPTDVTIREIRTLSPPPHLAWEACQHEDSLAQTLLKMPRHEAKGRPSPNFRLAMPHRIRRPRRRRRTNPLPCPLTHSPVAMRSRCFPVTIILTNCWFRITFETCILERGQVSMTRGSRLQQQLQHDFSEGAHTSTPITPHRAGVQYLAPVCD